MVMNFAAEALKIFQDDPTRKNYRVGIILMAPSGRCLALKRSETKKLGGGTWGVPGGKVEEGETLGQAAIREAGEETGVHPKRAALIHAETAGDIEFRTFVACVDEEFIPTLDHEHTDYEWSFPHEWPQPAFSGMKSVLEDTQAIQALERYSQKIQERFMPSETYKKFHDAVMNLAGTHKADDLCFTVIDNPEFHALAETSPQEAGQILTLAFNKLDQEDAFQAGMAIIDTPGVRALPEAALVDVLATAKERMTQEDQRIFVDYLSRTRTGKNSFALS